MLRRIKKEHPPREDLIERGKLALDIVRECSRERVTALTRETRIMQASQHVGVTTDKPRAVTKPVEPKHRCGGAQIAVSSIRISDKICIKHKAHQFIRFTKLSLDLRVRFR